MEVGPGRGPSADLPRWHRRKPIGIPGSLPEPGAQGPSAKVAVDRGSCLLPTMPLLLSPGLRCCPTLVEAGTFSISPSLPSCVIQFSLWIDLCLTDKMTSIYGSQDHVTPTPALYRMAPRARHWVELQPVLAHGRASCPGIRTITFQKRKRRLREGMVFNSNHTAK